MRFFVANAKIFCSKSGGKWQNARKYRLKIGNNKRCIERKFIMILRVFKSKSTEKTAFGKAIIRQKLRFVYSLFVNIIKIA